MHAAPDLTPAALQRWERMDIALRELMFARIWCGQCAGSHGIRDSKGHLHPSGAIMLSGVCPSCGGKVARVIETGETMGRAEIYT